MQQLLPPERGNDDDAAWLVSWKSEVGRCLVAARALPAGSIVFREQPLIVAPAASAGEDLMAASGEPRRPLDPLPPIGGGLGPHEAAVDLLAAEAAS